MTQNHIIQYFQYDHLKNEDLKKVSKLFHDLAHEIFNTPVDLTSDHPELLAGIGMVIDALSKGDNALLKNGDESEKDKCLFRLHFLIGLLKFEKFDGSCKKECLNKLLDAKDAAVRASL